VQRTGIPLTTDFTDLHGKIHRFLAGTQRRRANRTTHPKQSTLIIVSFLLSDNKLIIIHKAMKKSIGIIGGGRVTRLLLQGFNSRKVKLKRIVVNDVNPIVVEQLNREFPFIETNSASVAASQDIVFLALDAGLVMDTLGLLRDDFKNDTIIISLIPDVNFAKLALRLPQNARVARVLPVPSTYINDAYTPVSFSPDFPEKDRDDVLDLFGNFGRAVAVPEDKLQIYSTMAAILPAYFWYQWKELVDIGQEIGLTREETIDMINESMRSSLNLSYKSGLTEEQVVDLMPISPVEENEDEIREGYRQRLIDLYRRYKPELVESHTS
jgi:pyrroline-5-carboxylate reductase